MFKQNVKEIIQPQVSKGDACLGRQLFRTVLHTAKKQCMKLNLREYGMNELTNGYRVMKSLLAHVNTFSTTFGVKEIAGLLRILRVHSEWDTHQNKGLSHGIP